MINKNYYLPRARTRVREIDPLTKRILYNPPTYKAVSCIGNGFFHSPLCPVMCRSERTVFQAAARKQTGNTATKGKEAQRAFHGTDTAQKYTKQQSKRAVFSKVCYKVCYCKRKNHDIERYTVGFIGADDGNRTPFSTMQR